MESRPKQDGGGGAGAIGNSSKDLASGKRKKDDDDVAPELSRNVKSCRLQLSDDDDGASSGERILSMPSVLEDELNQTVKALQESLSRLSRVKESVNVLEKDKRRLQQFEKYYPNFDQKRREWKELLKEEKRLKNYVEELKAECETETAKKEKREKQAEVEVERMLKKLNNMVEEREAQRKRAEGQKRSKQEELGKTLKILKKALTDYVKLLNKKLDKLVKEFLQKQEEIEVLTKKVQKLKREERTGTGPVGAATGTEKGKKEASSLLPVELWTMNLAEVTDPKDNWNCSNTCGLFKQILKDWKKPTWEFMQAFPLLFQYLPQNQILKCRSVSKGWNMVVDQHMENHPVLRPRDNANYDPRMLPFVSPMMEKKFYRLNVFDFRLKGLQHKDHRFPHMPGRNPFLGRDVTLIIGCYQGEEVDLGTNAVGRRLFGEANPKRQNGLFWQRVYSFLKRFGKYIWYLSLVSADELGSQDCDYEGFDFYEKLRQLITVDLASLTPNLRRLHTLPSKDECNRHITPSGFTIASIPTILALETVVARSCYVYENYPVLPLLQKHHGTLRSVHLKGITWTSLSRLEWPQLKELHLDNLWKEFDFDHALIDAGARMPQLIKLGVNLRRGRGSFDGLLDVINQFFNATRPRLSTLRLLGGIEPRMFQRSRLNRCISPTLKTLEVEHRTENGFYYNFLLHFPFVEKVHFFWKKLHDDDDDEDSDSEESYVEDDKDSENSEVEDDENSEGSYGEGDEDPEDEEDEEPVEVDLHLFIDDGRVFQSNIWQLMPHLELFSYQSDVYTRMGYEQFMEQRRNVRE